MLNSYLTVSKTFL